MNPAPCSSSFGRYLRAIRIQRGIDLESVAREIRVGVGQLTLIESEDHSRLPDEIYVKGILRAYARCIGVDGDDIVERYLLNRFESDENSRSRAGSGFMGLKGARVWLLALGAILVMSCAIYGVWKYQPLPAPPHPAHTGNTPASDPMPPAIRQQGPWMLQIDAVEKTWIKVNIDGEEALDYLLNPGDHIELEARSRINMLIGNAGGLNMRLNDEPVAVPGTSGEVVNIELPVPSSSQK